MEDEGFRKEEKRERVRRDGGGRFSGGGGGREGDKRVVGQWVREDGGEEGGDPLPLPLQSHSTAVALSLQVCFCLPPTLRARNNCSTCQGPQRKALLGFGLCLLGRNRSKEFHINRNHL